MEVTTRGVYAVFTLLLLTQFSSLIATGSDGTETEQDGTGLQGIQIAAGENVVIPFTARSGTFWIEASCDGDCRELEMVLFDSDGNQHIAAITDTALLRGQIPAGQTDLTLLNKGEIGLIIDIQASLPVVDSVTELDASSSFDDTPALVFSNSDSVTSMFTNNTPEAGFADPKA